MIWHCKTGLGLAKNHLCSHKYRRTKLVLRYLKSVIILLGMHNEFIWFLCKSNGRTLVKITSKRTFILILVPVLLASETYCHMISHYFTLNGLRRQRNDGFWATVEYLRSLVMSSLFFYSVCVHYGMIFSFYRELKRSPLCSLSLAFGSWRSLYYHGV